MAEVAQTSIASALATGPFSFGFHGPSAEILRRKAEVCATEVFSAAATYGQMGPRLPPSSVDNCQQASHYLSSKANGMETVTRPSTRTKEVQEAIDAILAVPWWRLEQKTRTGHVWGTLFCGQRDRAGCKIW